MGFFDKFNQIFQEGLAKLTRAPIVKKTRNVLESAKQGYSSLRQPRPQPRPQPQPSFKPTGFFSKVGDIGSSLVKEFKAQQNLKFGAIQAGGGRDFSKSYAGKAYSVPKQIVTKTIPAFGKKVYGDVSGFGTAIGGAINAPHEAKINLESTKRVNEIVDKNMRTAIALEKQGKGDQAKRLYDLNEILLSRETQKTESLLDKYKRGKKELVSGGIKTAGYLPNIAGGGVLGPLLGGAISAGFAKAQGEDPYIAFGEGTADAKRFRLVTQFSDPLIGAIAGQLKPFISSSLGRQISTRVIAGFGNVAEDELLSKLDQENPGTLDRMASFAIGAVMSTGGRGSPQNIKELRQRASSELSRSMGESFRLDSGSKHVIDLTVDAVKKGHEIYKASPLGSEKGAFDPSAPIGRKDRLRNVLYYSEDLQKRGFTQRQTGSMSARDALIVKKHNLTPKQWNSFGEVLKEVGNKDIDASRLKTRDSFDRRFAGDPPGEEGLEAFRRGKILASQGLPTRELLRVTEDKSPFAFQRETIKRNIEDVFGKNSQMEKFVVDDMTTNELNATKHRNEIRQEMSQLAGNAGIRRGSKADKASADFIEGNLSKEQLQEQFPKKWQEIISMANEGRKVYKKLLTQINTEIGKYGYDPIPERQNYVTHTKRIMTFGEQVGSFLNIKEGELPRAMAAIHLDTKPGRKFFFFGLSRKGGQPGGEHEGLLISLDKYLSSATRQIHHTSDIQRGRAVMELLQDTGETDRTMSNFTSYFGQYVDMISGKQNILDRPFEKVLGRKLLNLGDWARKRTGANMVGGNVSSALTNFIPFTQSLSSTSKKNAVQGLLDSATSTDPGKVDGVESSFLTRRFVTEQMGKSKLQEVKDVSGFLFELVDKFTAKSIVAGKYREGIDQGLTKIEAMRKADDFGARVLADRSFGQLPLIFNSRVLGAFTQFQTEVNNQVSFLGKDIPKNLGFNKKQATSALVQFAIYAHIFNNVYEKITGRRPQVDPVYMGLTALGITPEGEDKTAREKGIEIFDQVRQGIPFASEGRLPVASALPRIGALVKGEADLLTEVKKPLYYLAPPFGGSQLKKTLEGAEAVRQGYSETRTGKVRFPVGKEDLKAGIFGQWSLSQGQDYIRGGFKPLSEKQTEKFKQYNDLGKGEDFFNHVIEQRKTDSDIKALRSYLEDEPDDYDFETIDPKIAGEAIWSHIKTLEKEKRNDAFEAMEVSPEIRKEVARIADLTSQGLSSIDRELLETPESIRVLAIYDRLMKLVVKNREAKYRELLEAGVITKEMIPRLKQMVEGE